MNLAHQHLRAILAGMHSPVPGQEKRRAQRFPVSANISFARLTDAGPQQWNTALSRDVSEAGLGFVTSLKVAPGEKLAVKLPTSGKQAVIACRVVHTRPVADGIWSVGLEFIELIEAIATTDRASDNPARPAMPSVPRPVRA